MAEEDFMIQVNKKGFYMVTGTFTIIDTYGKELYS
jgi:hypothetical protein